MALIKASYKVEGAARKARAEKRAAMTEAVSGDTPDWREIALAREQAQAEAAEKAEAARIEAEKELAVGWLDDIPMIGESYYFPE